MFNFFQFFRNSGYYPPTEVQLVNTLFHSAGRLFALLIKLLLLCRVFYFNLVPSVDSWIQSLCSGRSAQKSCLNLCLDVHPFCFLWLASASQVLNTVNFLTKGERCSNSIPHINRQFCQHHLLNKLSFSFCYVFLVSLSKFRWLKLCWLISESSLPFHWSNCLFLLFLCQAIRLSFSLQPCCII